MPFQDIIIWCQNFYLHILEISYWNYFLIKVESKQQILGMGAGEADWWQEGIHEWVFGEDWIWAEK